jgi:hypothetical protein
MTRDLALIILCISLSGFAVAAADPNVWVIHSDDLPLRPDFTHFDVPGKLELGERFGEAMLEAMEKKNE